MDLSPSGPNPLEGLVKGHEAGDPGAGARTQASSSPGFRPICGLCEPCPVAAHNSCLESEAGQELGMSSEPNQPSEYVVGQGKENGCDCGSQGCRTEETE